MGTSRNDRSPRIPPWKPALAVIGNEAVSPQRQSQEIWRAAFADRGSSLLEDFSHPALANACKLVSQRAPVHEALEKFDIATLHEDRSGLALTLGRRALARSLSTTASASDFAAHLFGDAVAYYASRDLPSFVGAPKRVATNSAAIDLKRDLVRIAREKAKTVRLLRTDSEHWRAYVSHVLALLRGVEPHD